MKLLKELCKTLQISLVDTNLQLEAIGKLDKYYPEELKKEVEEDKRRRNENK